VRKHALFIVLAGLSGAASGVAGFALARMLFGDVAISAVTGGLAAVVVPILLVLLYHPRMMD